MLDKVIEVPCQKFGIWRGIGFLCTIYCRKSLNLIQNQTT